MSKASYPRHHVWHVQRLGDGDHSYEVASCSQSQYESVGHDGTTNQKGLPVVISYTAHIQITRPIFGSQPVSGMTSNDGLGSNSYYPAKRPTQPVSNSPPWGGAFIRNDHVSVKLTPGQFLHAGYVGRISSLTILERTGGRAARCSPWTPFPFLLTYVSHKQGGH